MQVQSYIFMYTVYVYSMLYNNYEMRIHTSAIHSSLMFFALRKTTTVLKIILVRCCYSIALKKASKFSEFKNKIQQYIIFLVNLSFKLFQPIIFIIESLTNDEGRRLDEVGAEGELTVEKKRGLQTTSRSLVGWLGL